MNIGQKVKLMRFKRGIETQCELSAMTGLSRGYVSLLEQDDSVGARKVSDIKKIARAGNIPSAYLLVDDAPEPMWDECKSDVQGSNELSSAKGGEDIAS